MSFLFFLFHFLFEGIIIITLSFTNDKKIPSNSLWCGDIQLHVFPAAAAVGRQRRVPALCGDAPAAGRRRGPSVLPNFHWEVVRMPETTSTSGITCDPAATPMAESTRRKNSGPPEHSWAPLMWLSTRAMLSVVGQGRSSLQPVSEVLGSRQYWDFHLVMNSS